MKNKTTPASDTPIIPSASEDVDFKREDTTKTIRKPLVHMDKDWFFAMNTLQKLGVIKYKIQDEDGKTVYLNRNTKNKDKLYYYVITDFNKKKRDELVAALGRESNDNVDKRRNALNLLISGDESHNYINNFFYTNSIRDFSCEKHKHTVSANIPDADDDSNPAIKKELKRLPKPIIASLDFDGPSIEVQLGKKVYEFSKNLRGGMTMDILSVVAYSTNIGKRFMKKDLEKHNIKTSRNLVEVFKNNLIGNGQKGVLSPFACISPVAIQMMPKVELSLEEARRIMVSADSIREADTFD